MVKIMKAINAKKSEFFTIPQVAALLGISRIAIYKQVKRGDIKAIKIGKNYAISASYLLDKSGKTLSPQRKMAIKRAVQKTVKEYGPLLVKLGNE